jgi:hypothetical protein
MNPATLHQFYQFAVLPQFAMQDCHISWGESKLGDGDEAIHYFACEGAEYALIFEDYDGLGRNDAYIRHHVLGRFAAYEFVKPTSATNKAPTYDGFRLSTPSVYCDGVTGNFTLLRLLERE